ncbi:hypothetical protein GF378_02935 [Candidatus Pacearchaeota archaeon]|nr:hypothetical protein [Candidatus Pacearchaeota archaeon]
MEIIKTTSLPDNMYYGNIPVEEMDKIFSNADKLEKNISEILISESEAVVHLLDPQFCRYNGGHTEKSVQRLKDLGAEPEELPRVLLNPRVMGISQRNYDSAKKIIEARDVENLDRPPYWLVNGNGKTFYLRDNKPAGRSIKAGEWLPNPIACRNKYLGRLEKEEGFREIFFQFKEKGYIFEDEVLDRAELPNKSN